MAVRTSAGRPFLVSNSGGLHPSAGRLVKGGWGLAANHADGLQRGPLDRLHSGTPHPGPLRFRRGEGEPSTGFGVVDVADYSVKRKRLKRRLTLFVANSIAQVV